MRDSWLYSCITANTFHSWSTNFSHFRSFTAHFTKFSSISRKIIHWFVQHLLKLNTMTRLAFTTCWWRAATSWHRPGEVKVMLKFWWSLILALDWDRSLWRILSVVWVERTNRCHCHCKVKCQSCAWAVPMMTLASSVVRISLQLLARKSDFFLSITCQAWIFINNYLTSRSRRANCSPFEHLTIKHPWNVPSVKCSKQCVKQITNHSRRFLRLDRTWSSKRHRFQCFLSHCRSQAKTFLAMRRHEWYQNDWKFVATSRLPTLWVLVARQPA